MDELYSAIRKRAHEIAAGYRTPLFYLDYSQQIEISKAFYASNPVVTRLRKYVRANVDEDLGHGMVHAEKVTIDAGALFLSIEGRTGRSKEERERGLLLVQCAGLLHDIRRKEKKHATAGAKAAKKILAAYPFSDEEVDIICLAISNHEAFQEPEAAASVLGEDISDCLYDADKFRWGPDNFTDTVWHMISFFKAPVSVFLDRYPEGIKGIVRIKKTFRSRTGRRYGPDFVDIGLEMGEEIHAMLKKEFLKL